MAVEKEIWESQVDGRTSVVIEDARGKTRTETVIGKGRRLRITTQERELIEEQVRYDHLNPFRNGTLVQVNAPKSAKTSEQAMTDEELLGLFDLSDDDFAGALPDLSEVNVRRLKALAKAQGSPARVGHSAALDEHIEKKYPIGGDTKTYREMFEIPESARS